MKPFGHAGGGTFLQLGGPPVVPAGHFGGSTMIFVQLGGVPRKPGPHVVGIVLQFGYLPTVPVGHAFGLQFG